MEAGSCPKAGQGVAVHSLSRKKIVPLWLPYRLLLVKRLLAGLQGNDLQKKAGDEIRTRDSLLGRQELYH